MRSGLPTNSQSSPCQPKQKRWGAEWGSVGCGVRAFRGGRALISCAHGLGFGSSKQQNTKRIRDRFFFNLEQTKAELEKPLGILYLTSDLLGPKVRAIWSAFPCLRPLKSSLSEPRVNIPKGRDCRPARTYHHAGYYHRAEQNNFPLLFFVE